MTTFRHGASRVRCAWEEGHEGPCEGTNKGEPMVPAGRNPRVPGNAEEPTWPETAMPTAQQYLDWLIWHIERGSTDRPLVSLERLLDNAYNGIQCYIRHPRELSPAEANVMHIRAGEDEHPDHQPQVHTHTPLCERYDLPHAHRLDSVGRGGRA